MIALLTDFGESEYVGIMKGVIHQIDYDCKIIDITHSIHPQSVIEASWILSNSYSYFPHGTTFCCVVDPGVGSTRKAIAVKTKHYAYVAPDNGLLWETLKKEKKYEIYQIPIPNNASKTFHGRDVFAKSAAKINFGLKIGKKISKCHKLSFHKKVRQGIVTRIDRFGNIITNLSKLNKKIYVLKRNNSEERVSFYKTYKEGKNLFLIEGSSNTLEISKKNGNANRELNLKPGDKLTLK